MDLVKQVREKVETMGFNRKDYYTRDRLLLVEGRVFLKAEIKKKDGRRFEGLVYWRAPPRTRSTGDGRLSNNVNLLVLVGEPVGNKHACNMM
jgi:hypothetical protein